MKERKKGVILKHKREKIKRDIEKYKRGIERLESLKERINKLESLGYSNRETEKLKYELNKDIMNLRKRSK